MRLLYVTPGFPAHERDENCIPPLQFLVKDMLHRGASVDVIALEYPFHCRPYAWHGVRVYPCGGGNRAWLRWLTLSRANNCYAALKKQGKYDFLHAFWLTTAFRIVRNWAASDNIRWCATAMGQDVVTAAQRVKKLREQAARHVIVLSDYHHAMLAAATGCMAERIVPWGYPDDEIPQKLPENRPLDVLGVGALLPVKNFTTWISTIAVLKKTFPSIRAGICGAGSQLSSLKKQVAACQLTENVVFWGELPRHRVLEKMRQSKVLLHTAAFESFGMVVVEALANGCRVVATPVGIAPQLETVALGCDAHHLAGELANMLQLPPVQQPLVPLHFNDTGRKYWEIYHSG